MFINIVGKIWVFVSIFFNFRIDLRLKYIRVLHLCMKALKNYGSPETSESLVEALKGLMGYKGITRD